MAPTYVHETANQYNISYNSTTPRSESSFIDSHRNVLLTNSYSRLQRSQNQTAHPTLILPRSSARLEFDDSHATSLAEIPIGLSRLVNYESRTRFMIDRLHSLARRICELRLSTSGLTLSRFMPAGAVASQSLTGVDQSLEMLDKAIGDLEATVVTVAQRLERTSRLTITPRSSSVFDSRPMRNTPSFTAIPSRSLISRARNVPSGSSAQSISIATALEAANSLEARLGSFSASLTALNSRLDRVAHNFQELRTVPTAVQTENASDMSTLFRATASQRTISTSPHLSTFNPPEDMSLETTNSNIITLTTSDRIAMRNHVDVMIDDLSRMAQVDSPASNENEHRLNQLRAESAHIRRNDRVSQEHALFNQETSLHCEPCQTKVPQQVVAVSRPNLSSHVPLTKHQQRMFVNGIEYRNCLGLWLSKNGQPAPAHAIPSSNVGEETIDAYDDVNQCWVHEQESHCLNVVIPSI